MNATIATITLELTDAELAAARDAADMARDAEVITLDERAILDLVSRRCDGINVITIVGEQIEDLEDLATAIDHGGEILLDTVSEEELSGFEAIGSTTAAEIMKRVGRGIFLVIEELRGAGKRYRRELADLENWSPAFDAKRD